MNSQENQKQKKIRVADKKVVKNKMQKGKSGFKLLF